MKDRIETLLHEESRFEPPAELEFATKLPKTRSAKIMRRVLKAQELGLDLGDVSTIEE